MKDIPVEYQSPVDCYECKGTGKVAKYIRLIQEAQHEKGAEKIINAAFAQGELYKKTDKEIADIVLQHFYRSEGDLVRSAVLSTVIDRLQRANGSAMPEETDV